MTIAEAFDFLNFWINKSTNAWYTIPELTLLVNRAQTALYSDYKNRYASSQLIKDALSPFRKVYNFTTQISGYVIVPQDTTYLDFLDLQIYFQISDRTVYYPVKLYNEDERANRLNSQINPITITSPIGEQTAPRTFRLYPAGAYNGNVTYLRKPAQVVFGYDIISGRVIVYNPSTSVQFEWRDTEIDQILLKALSSIGINLPDNGIQQWAEAKTTNNYQSVNRI